MQNYNRALAEISEGSHYCKIVQADDWIFPECLHAMVKTFEQSASVGLVSSYCQVGDVLEGPCYPFQGETISGRECARWYLQTGYNVFGSQTTIMYRSSLVRQQRPFYNELLPHADLEKCMEILEHWDFGFVRQVLSFVRRENDSINSSLITFGTSALSRYITLQRYAPVFLEASEATCLKASCKRMYYRTLAKAVFRFRKSGFWQYHKKGLSTLGEPLDRPYLVLQTAVVLFWMAMHPRKTVMVALSSWHRKLSSKRQAKSHLNKDELAAGFYGESSRATRE